MTDTSNIDLQRDSGEGAWCDILLPDGSESDIKLLVTGPDHPDVLDVRQRAASANMNPIISETICLEIFKEYSIAAVKDVKGWTENEKDVTVEMLPDLLEKHKTWILRQIFTFGINRGNFFRLEETT